MTRKEIIKAVNEGSRDRVLAVYDERANTFDWIMTGNIGEIAAVECYFDYRLLKDWQTLYHFLRDAEEEGVIWYKDAQSCEGEWGRLN